MKKIIILPLLMLFVAISMVVRGEAASSQDNAATQDSTIDVIAWFNKHDTAIYCVDQTKWKINGADTALAASYRMFVRVNVVDSTAAGYKIDYTFMEFPPSIIPDSASAIEKFQSQISDKLSNKIVGKTVHVETDECGRITRINNLGQVKKQAKSLFNEAIKELSQLPELKSLKEYGFDIKDITKKVDTDKLIDGYLEELNMLFAFHGLSMKIGETTEHDEATDSTYENTRYFKAMRDDENNSYHIVSDVTSIVTGDDLNEITGGIVKSISNDSIASIFKEKRANVSDCVTEDYMKSDYLLNGWPYFVVRHRSAMIDSAGTVNQIIISLDSYSFQ